ncbi:hypothetical protein PALB_8900 [Pseudoalteromonas luteoviolacea B = ATCC 29581]|nr:hypothetical protein PALB_8900 [Pseudoalteromonas luteoviolacea B = ATCC 29581]
MLGFDIGLKQGKAMNLPYYTLLTLFSSVSLAQEPFDICPSQAFLVQKHDNSNAAIMFGVNLATGSNKVLSDNMNTSERINGVGFNLFDRFIYGWGYEENTMIKIGKDFKAQKLEVFGLPDTNFFVGDVSTTENALYLYRRGGSFGLYRIPLDQTTYNAKRVADGNTLNLSIFDLAFHPDNGKAYSVDSNGMLYSIDVSNGNAAELGNIGESGTFGAVYFDVTGQFYISRNQDGSIFRIDVAQMSPSAEFFAYGPSSSSNDGARCATAPVIDVDDLSVDFGDAPESYGSSIEKNGARHEIGELYLGSGITGEPQPAKEDDDDGVFFVTGFETGFETKIIVNASRPGYLHAWIDWDSDGVFDTKDKAVSARELTAGNNEVFVNVPIDALPVGTPSQQTWIRLRLSDKAELGPKGGVNNGEVEDYPITITNSGIESSFYPSSGYTTIAFEDSWPEQGDYDFNDVVVQYRVRKDMKDNQVVQYAIEGQLTAVGASYHNGFAIRFEGIEHGAVQSQRIALRINGEIQAINPLESAAISEEATLIVFNDTKSHFQLLSGCRFFRTEPNCTSQPAVTFSVSLPLITGVADDFAPQGALDPFIFAVNGFSHGAYVQPSLARQWEVHLKNRAPTPAFATGFGLADDASSPSDGLFFQTSQGLPFALEVGATWRHPQEKVDLIKAYPAFVEFATQKGSPSWFQSPVIEHVAQ